MATFASKETEVRKTGQRVGVPPHDVCRLSYYLRSSTLSCGVDIIVDDLVDFKNAHKLPSSRIDAIFELAVTSFKVDNLLNKTIFEDDDGSLCGDSDNEFLEITRVTSILSVQSQVLLGGKVSNVSKIMFFKPVWLKRNYYEPLQRNRARLVRHIGVTESPLGLVQEILEAVEKEIGEKSQHCSHCKGLDGDCACKSSCPTKEKTKCSAVHHCRHCKGFKGGACACKLGCPVPSHARCQALHNISCDGCDEDEIQGPRYKCADCPFFDLCSSCYNDGKHDMTHKFKKIERVGEAPKLLAPREAPKKQQLFCARKPKAPVRAPTPTPAPAPAPVPSSLSTSKSSFVGEGMSVLQMKNYLRENGVSAAGAAEKDDLRRLVWTTQIEGLGAAELDSFMSSQGITVKGGMSVAAKRAHAIGAYRKQKRPLSASESASSSFKAGQVVQLCGLQKKEMNGLSAEVVRDELEQGRVEIQLLEGLKTRHRVKPENLSFSSTLLD